ncbi:MAG TPA: DUF547 domain-containing protein, partial [Thermoanaerobaculia bacterium]|nr:DUF547 domain-containing protein [Thermoanaerobaculia bacterium]
AARAAARAAAPAGGTAAWDRLARKHVRDGGVDYAAVARDRADLDAFLAHVRRTDPAKLPTNDRLAFLTNAYNAVVVHHVLALYPGVKSVKDVDGFFDEKTFPVGGKPMTLDALETAAREIDPRVHFAVVCASTSCPDLRGEAYTGARIDRQLREQTHRFLADPNKGLRYDEKANELHLSSIFKWYAQDFTDSSRVVAFFARGGVRDWVVEHLGDRRLAERIRQREPGVRYMDYDWSLNDR